MIVRTTLVVLVCVAAMFLLRRVQTLRPGAEIPLAEIDWRFEPQSAAGSVGQSRQVRLPDHWSQDRRGLVTGRYTGTFVLPEGASGDAPWAAYFTSVGGDLSLAVNGVRLIGEGGLNLQTSRFQPLLIRISPPIRVTAGDLNQIVIDLHSDRVGGTFMGQVYVGPEPAMARSFAQRHFFKRTLPLMIDIVVLLLGTISFILWRGRRHDRVFLWHALACYVLGAYIVVAVGEPWLPNPWWEVTGFVLATWFGHCCALLGVHLYGVKPRGFIRALSVTSVAGPVILLTGAALLDTRRVLGVLAPGLWMAYLVVVLAIITLIYWPGFRRLRDTASFWMMVSAALIGVGAIQDGLTQLGLLAPHEGLVGAYVIVLPAATFLGILLQRFRNALTDAEALNLELEQRVAARELQIAGSYQALREVERERSVAAERERFFRDMHDGVGSTLVAALARLSNEGAGHSPAAQSVKSALEDLRLMLASLDPEERSVRAALAGVRERIENACADAGIALDYDVRALPDEFELPPARLLQVLRIVQEASANAVRHAHARRLGVRFALHPQDEALAPCGVFEVQIDDDGVGFDAEQSPRPGHHGLANLRKRAAQLGGDIAWTDLRPGTRVRLRFPLDVAEK